jgi:integrase
MDVYKASHGEADWSALLGKVKHPKPGLHLEFSRVVGRQDRDRNAWGYRDGENPARWRGHLDHLLAKPSKAKKVVHHAAMPYGDLPAFLLRLREQETSTAWALEFLILTAARTSEALSARERDRHKGQDLEHS